MTILSAQTIRDRISRFGSLQGYHKEKWGLLIKPFEEKAKQALGMSYGLSSCGYDIRVGKIDGWNWVSSENGAYDPFPVKSVKPVEAYNLKPGEFLLASSLEYMELPHDIAGKVHDKSTLARQGLALQNTILEPGWKGYITLELSNHSNRAISIRVGQPIAQVVFEFLDAPTILPYVGKYQDQTDEPTHAILTEDSGEVA